jgi:hypothetical protein
MELEENGTGDTRPGEVLAKVEMDTVFGDGAHTARQGQRLR